VATEGSEVSGLAGRYGTALFELAVEQKALDPVAADLAGIKRLLSESAELRRLVRSPAFTREDQSRAMGALLDKGGAAELTRRFVGLLAQKRRLFVLDGVIAVFARLNAAHRGEVAAEVVSAAPLSAERIESVTKTLAKVIGGRVALETRVDERLIGGLVVRVGSRMVDSSVRTKLQRLQLAMKGVG
jgi:F-type H+-transporting ATPase subunit delta